MEGTLKLLVVNGSYRRGKTIDTLLAKAVEGLRSTRSDVDSEEIILSDRHIEYCTNCMACKKADPSLPYAPCTITNDDMSALVAKVQEADVFLFGSPVNNGTVTAVMKTFLDRLVWTCATPVCSGIMAGAPTPRVKRRRAAGIIVSTGLTPAILKWFCDHSMAVMKGVCRDALNAKVVAGVYAGAVEKHGTQPYLQRAFALGERLARVVV